MYTYIKNICIDMYIRIHPVYSNYDWPTLVTEAMVRRQQNICLVAIMKGSGADHKL